MCNHKIVNKGTLPEPAEANAGHDIDSQKHVINVLSSLASKVQVSTHSDVICKYIGAAVAIIIISCTIIICCMIKSGSACNTCMIVIIVGFLILLLSIVLGLLYFNRHNSPDIPDAYYRYQTHIADVIRDIYEIERKELPDSAQSAVLMDISNKIITKDQLGESLEGILNVLCNNIKNAPEANIRKLESLSEKKPEDMSKFLLEQIKELCAKSEVNLNMTKKP